MGSKSFEYKVIQRTSLEGATPYKENITEEEAEQIKAELRKKKSNARRN